MRVKVYTPQRFISALILRDGNKCENELVMTLRAVNIKDTNYTMLVVKKVTEEKLVGNHSCIKYQLKHENGTGQLPGLPDITGRSSRLVKESCEEIAKLPECLK